MADVVKVSQEAREAAADYLAEKGGANMELTIEMMRRGNADGHVAVQAFQRAIAQADAAERERVRTVFLPAILHGDEAHRGWLAAAVDAYIAGTPIPPPTGKGNSEAADATGYRRAVEEAAAWHDNKAVAARKKSSLRMNLALVAARIHDESALAIRALAEPKE